VENLVVQIDLAIGVIKMNPKWFWLAFCCIALFVLINRILIIKVRSNKRLLKLHIIFSRISAYLGWLFLVAFLISIFVGIQMFGSRGL
jgi:bacteriorhodopsin